MQCCVRVCSACVYVCVRACVRSSACVMCARARARVCVLLYSVVQSSGVCLYAVRVLVRVWSFLCLYTSECVLFINIDVDRSHW